MTITIGGKPVQPRKAKTIRQATLGKHRLLDGEQIRQRHPGDPFPPISVFRNDPVEERISVGCELQMWVEQKLHEMVVLADEENWLRLKLRDPDLADNPHRPDAENRLTDLQYQLAQTAGEIAFMEAHADRIWQSLDIADRELMAAKWCADVNDDRLILNSWKVIAQVGFKWPDYYQVERSWFSHLGDVLEQDMNDRGLTKGIPLGKQWEEDTNG